MTRNAQLNSTDEILAQIKELLSRAENVSDRGGDATWLLESAFVRTRMLLEALEMLDALASLKEIQHRAENDLVATDFDDEVGESYLIWAAKLREYLYSLEGVFGQSKSATISKDLVQILRATQYSITDKNCFGSAPMNERDVHVRIEAVLRCVFPDLISKPRITKQIKHFEPDTGLPSLRTLIEYKFIAMSGDEKRVADELLADTRGYVSKDWDTFIYLVYETTRLRSEDHWRQLMRDSDVNLRSTNVIVISGEEPSRSHNLKRAKSAGGTDKS